MRMRERLSQSPEEDAKLGGFMESRNESPNPSQLRQIAPETVLNDSGLLRRFNTSSLETELLVSWYGLRSFSLTILR